MSTVKESREVSGFKSVVLRGYGDLEVHQEQAAAGPGKLTIEADEKVMPIILAEVREDRLVLGFSLPWYEWLLWWRWLFVFDKRVKFRLTSAGVEALSIQGAGVVSSDRFDAPKLALKVSGAGK